MLYPAKDILEDFTIISNPAIPGAYDILSEERFFKVIEAFFLHRYKQNLKMGMDRYAQLRKAMALIQNSETDLVALGLITKRPAKVQSLAKASLLLAAHELVNTRGIEQPTREQLKEAILRIEGEIE